MWQLTSNEPNKRTYINAVTGEKSEQTQVYLDKDKNGWWQFNDNTTIPWTRKFVTMKIEALFTLGLSKDDLSNHINGLKKILKSNDSEKYEMAFANILDFESKAANATDAIKQIISMVCVYFTLNDELIDSWDNTLQIKKMSIIEADPEMHAFFLRRQMEYTDRSMQHSNLLSQIALSMSNGESVPLE